MTLEVLARSDLARNEDLQLFDIAWKNASGDDSGDATGQEERLDREFMFVDSDGNISENGTTDGDRTGRLDNERSVI